MTSPADTASPVPQSPPQGADPSPPHAEAFDHAYFPHILEAIVRLAPCAVLAMLRNTSHAVRHLADAELMLRSAHYTVLGLDDEDQQPNMAPHRIMDCDCCEGTGESEGSPRPIP